MYPIYNDVANNTIFTSNDRNNIQQQQFYNNQDENIYRQNEVTPSPVETNIPETFTFDEIGAIIDNELNQLNQAASYTTQVLNEPQFVQSINNNNLIYSEQDRNITQEQQIFDENQHQEQAKYIVLRNPFDLSEGGEEYSTNVPLEEISCYGNNDTLVMTNIEPQQTTNMALKNNQRDGNQLNCGSAPYVEIVEQPAKCSLRFRYKCEGRSAGSIPGVNSTIDNKTYPSIKISNYTGRAVVVISCVTKDAPYKAHPHNIVGKEGCKKGVCTIVFNNEKDTIRSFSSLGIQCVKKKDIEDSLSSRESINVDPFRNGFSHKLCASNIDLNVIRLCFQVFIEGSTPNKYDVPLTPVVSDPIHDKKAMSDLVITKLSHCSAPATGGREVILLCDRISKDDIQIRFYEERNGELIWESYAELSPTDVHKQVAICFKTPKYYNENITQPVTCRIQLKRNSDNQVSEPRIFQFLPCESDEDIITRKRKKMEWVSMNHDALDNILQPNLHHYHHQQPHHQRVSTSQQHNLNHQQEQEPRFCVLNQNQHNEASPSPVQNRGPPLPPLPPIYQPKQRPTTSSNAEMNSNSRKTTNSPTSTTQQQDKFSNDGPTLVVRREIVDNNGKIMQLVDRSNQDRQLQQDLSNNKQLGSSLDRIDTAELMRDMTFNSNMDLNLGSGLSLHLNGGENSMHQMEHHVPSSSTTTPGGRNREHNGNNNNIYKDC